MALQLVFASKAIVATVFTIRYWTGELLWILAMPDGIVANQVGEPLGDELTLRFNATTSSTIGFRIVISFVEDVIAVDFGGVVTILNTTAHALLPLTRYPDKVTNHAVTRLSSFAYLVIGWVRES